MEYQTLKRKKLEDPFAEADKIIEQHPELIEDMDQKQFEQIEKLVEDVETDDLPTRLRELAPQLKEIMGMIPAEKDGAIRMLDYMRALEAEVLGDKFEEWVAEPEKED